MVKISTVETVTDMSYRQWLVGMAMQGLVQRMDGARTVSCEEMERMAGDYADAAMAAAGVDRESELQAALDRSGFDLSPCFQCGELVVCLPDGMPCCEPCAAKLAADQTTEWVAETGGARG